MFLLDTNVISELRKVRAGKADRNVTAWARSVPPATLFLSMIVVQELKIGTLLAERRNPPQGRSCARDWTSMCCPPFPSASCRSTRRWRAAARPSMSPILGRSGTG
jgi:predicted nucleic acid-binding protein